MIIGNLVLPAIGGGVCQTATTLFNDAFETGLPILNGRTTNLYLSTIPARAPTRPSSWGGPDLKFKNDLKHAILIKSSYTGLDADLPPSTGRRSPAGSSRGRAPRSTFRFGEHELCGRPERPARLGGASWAA